MSEEEIINVKGRLAPKNTGTVYLLSAGYDGQNKKAFLRLYEPVSEEIFLWYDNTGHLPYLVSKEPVSELEKNVRITGHEGFKGFQEVIRYDALEEKDILVTKIFAGDPLSIGGGGNSIRNHLDESFENRIRYYASYVYDQGLVPGMPYKVVNGSLVADDWSMPPEIEQQFNDVLVNTEERFKEPMKDWARLLQAPIPNIRRVAVDIEVRPSVQNRMPSADDAIDPIITVAFAGSDGLRKVIMFDDLNTGEIVKEVPGATEVTQYDTERQVIEETLRIIDGYPIVLTFNGDDFDFKFLRNRARNLGVPEAKIPITLGRRFAFLTNGVHIDLYQFFRNRSIQGYAFGNAYREFSLDDIAMGILNQGKIKVDFNNLNMRDMAEYCMQDTYITYQLTSFNDNLVMNLAIMLQRISKMILEDLTRFGVSRWILGLMEWMHRQEQWLIPNTKDIILHKGGTTTTAMIKGKKYQGAIVRDPVPGIHFEVTVVDFASLYPSAIRNWNLSYDTLLCKHEECKTNLIPGTAHWACTKKHGMTSTLIGSLRDLRVLWYKPKAKDMSLTEDERFFYHVTQQALKVFLNASYGVFGAESFPLYCPPLAESTAAVGRFAMAEAGRVSEDMGVEVLYGDTDSVFLNHPTPEQTNHLVKWADDALGIDLEVEKTYRYAIFSKRKKNYLGVYKDGKMDIKGLTGKKRHIPPILKEAFVVLTDILSNVMTMDDFPVAKEDIKGLVVEVHTRLKNREFKIEEVAFQMQLGKPLKQYDTNPQHVKAGRMLEEMGYEIAQGDIIRYVVTKNDVKPSIIAQPKDVDIKKYEGYLESTFEQLLDALDMSFDALVGRPQQKSLSAFFG
jgi:DNA polymerase, archaea type